MESIHKRAIIAVSIFVALGVHAQENEAPEERSYPISINAEVGTTGIGGTVAWRFHDHLGVRGGIQIHETT